MKYFFYRLFKIAYIVQWEDGKFGVRVGNRYLSNAGTNNLWGWRDQDRIKIKTIEEATKTLARYSPRNKPVVLNKNLNEYL